LRLVSEGRFRRVGVGQAELFPGLGDLAEPEEEEAEVKPNRDSVRKPAREGAEPGKRARRVVLVEEPDGRGGLGFGVGRVGLRCGRELALRRNRPVEALESDAVEDLRA